MWKAVLTGLLMALRAVPALAQGAPRVELFAGYSYFRADVDNLPLGNLLELGSAATLRGELQGIQGYRASLGVGLGRYVILKADYSYHATEVEFGPAEIYVTLHTLLGGFQVGPAAGGSGRVRPLIYALAGVARRINEVELLGSTTDSQDDVVSGAAGAGLDLTLARHVGLRLIQVDYNPTRFGDRTQHNWRASIGIALH